jgi:alpha-mannosidase
MYDEKQIERTLGKLKRMEGTLEPMLFTSVARIDERIVKTDGSYQKPPEDELFTSVPDGTVYEGEGIYCWTKSSFTVPEELAGKKLFFMPHTEAYEGLLFVDGVPYGNFAHKKLRYSHGNHYCDMFTPCAEAGRTYTFAVEYYANHLIVGSQPLTPDPPMKYEITYHPADICVYEPDIAEFYYDLVIADQMAENLDKDSYRRAEIVRALEKVHAIVYYDPACIDRETFIAALKEADSILKEILSHKNAASAPYVGLVGHSHMDTAWLWYRAETEKKCARTYSNQISLMDQYPEYTFIQSSAYHGDMMRRLYPDVFRAMQEKVAEGRYEPNGGVWIECDCNIPAGEYMIRQFLYGQRFTRKYFNYTADCFWLPDTFGYSAALPQIMHGCGIRYFLTTKLSWNDVNEFPYDTFIWEGIDGSRVLTHFNRSHLWPSPENMINSVEKGGFDSVKEREVSNMRLFSYGFGDGGGGPEFGMIEMAERLHDVEGLPRSSFTTVSGFMQQLEKNVQDPSVYSGELYLELHRGTLTNQHQIKRNNRKAEFALHDLEYLLVREAVKNGKDASEEIVRPLMEEFLVNQFHDILPGTGIARTNREARESVGKILKETAGDTKEILEGLSDAKKDTLTLINTLGFDRSDVQYALFGGKYASEGTDGQQVFTDIHGNTMLALSGVSVPSFGSTAVPLTDRAPEETKSPFVISEDLRTLKTPFYDVQFNEKGYIDSLVDREENREIRGEGGYALGTLLFGEEVSLGWDNWDVDIDLEKKLHDSAKLLSRGVVADGPVEIRIRSRYRLSAKSTITQDVVFYAGSRLVRYDNIADWQDDHRFLRAAFDTSIHTDCSREEIQFGYLRRPNNRNTSVEKARFEVSNHKYADLSETRYGVSVLNDCKYGISICGGSMRLSLHKGGCLPDTSGDHGQHEFSYALLPHEGGFGSDTVIHPAYCFNVPEIIAEKNIDLPSFVRTDRSDVLVETVKPLEDTAHAFLLRVYEAEGAHVNTKLSFGIPVSKVYETNMLEENQKEIPAAGNEIALTFRPFEIKSIRVEY